MSAMASGTRFMSGFAGWAEQCVWDPLLQTLTDLGLIDNLLH